MYFLPGLGDFGKDFVVGKAADIAVAEPKVFHPAAAGGDVADVAVEHGERGGGVLDEYAELHLLLAQGLLDTSALRDVDAGADVTEEVAFRAVIRRSALQYPAKRPLGIAQAVFCLLYTSRCV